MTTRPILFDGESVRAILAGTKTQTRRVVTPHPLGNIAQHPTGRWYPANFMDDPIIGKVSWTCPYGLPGDTLWVRETWQHEDICCDDHRCGQPSHIYYKATEVAPETMRWRPSIYMPRWASRITLEVTDVRVERVQEISRADAKSEGIVPGVDGLEHACGQKFGNAQLAFQCRWDSINAKRGFGWDKNPWVWVVEFERAET